MTRAITPTELAYLRRDNQWSELFLAIHQPATVFTARLGTPPASNDLVTQIAYTGGSGSGALAGQTICIGTSAGAWDKGQVRLRTTPTLGATGTLEIGITSEIAWATGDYLTILDEFGLWARQIRAVSKTEAYADYDIAYSNQHANFAPVVVMGSPVCVWLTGASVSVSFDAGDSWTINGAAKTYVWTAPGASATSGTTTATPTITYNAAGTYRVACAVTANGVTTTGYRYVFVFSAASMPVTQFAPGSIGADESGWSFDVTLWAEAALPTVRDRALVVLFARDHYGALTQSLGPLSGRENVIAWGWILGESIDWQAEQSSVRFQLAGPAAWLNKITAFPIGAENVNAAPALWTEFQSMTVDQIVWDALYWRSTLTNCADWSLTGDAKLIQAAEAPASTLWEQVTVIAQNWLLARPRCDRYGRLWVQVDGPCIPVADRASVPVVMTLTGADWRDTLNIQRSPTANVALLDISGVYFDGYNPTGLFSYAQGATFGRWGTTARVERLALASQAQLNELAGLYLADQNNPYPSATCSLAANNRFFDIAPRQFAALTLSASDTPRGASFSGDWWVRRVSLQWQAEAGALLTQLELRAVVDAAQAVTHVMPAVPPAPDPTPPAPPSGGGGGGADGNLVYVADAAHIGRTRNFLSSSPAWQDVTGAIDTAAYGAIRDFCLDPWDSANAAYAVTESAVWKTTNLNATTPTWTRVYTAASTYSVYRVRATIAQQDKLYISVGQDDGSHAWQYTAYTTDGGSTWSALYLVGGGTSGANRINPYCLDAGQHDAAIVYPGTAIRHLWPYVLKASNVSGTYYYYMEPVDKLRSVSVHIPYAGNPDDVIYYALLSGNDRLRKYTITQWGGAFGDSERCAVTFDSYVLPYAIYGYGETAILITPWDAIKTGTQDGNIIYLLYESAANGWVLLRSDDGGANWTTLQTGGTGGHAIGLWPYDTRRCFCFWNGTPRYSTDSGATLQDKTGDWATAIGAQDTPVMIVPAGW